MKTNHFNFDTRLTHASARLCAGLLGAVLVSAPLSAAMASDSWIACDGNLVVKKGAAAATTTPVHDVYDLDDSARALFKYSDVRKRLDMISVKTYDAKAITWENDGEGFGSQAATWQGRLDRSKMAVSIVRKDGDETSTWTQSCKPTEPLPTN